MSNGGAGENPAETPARGPLKESGDLRAAVEQWRADAQAASLRDACFSTLGGEELPQICLPADLDAAGDYLDQLGLPGQFPFTRGPYASMYRGRLWTMRQFAGFGTARDTNERYKYLLDHGQTGLSVAFDMPTLMGLDSDHARSEGEVGRCGVAVSSLADMEVLFDGIPLDRVSTSMTINGPAVIILAFYLAVAEKQGVSFDKVSGTLQNDILKEYQAQKEYLFPPLPSMRLVTDSIEYCTRHVPRWHPVSISGYHIREAGSTAAQELAFTLANGFCYVEDCLRRGLDVDAFAPRLSFFFNSHSDFFEEIAKFRAARRIWARHMRDRYGAKATRSLTLRFHTQTAGCSLTAQQPLNNVVRVAIQALAGVMGGTQSLHTNSLDETLALPTEESAKTALRTQQVIAEETGVANVIDPLGGSWLVESLTDRMEALAEDYFLRIEEQGGVIEAIEKGWFQQEIGDASYRLQREYESQERIVVGVNRYVESEEEGKVDILRISQETEDFQNASLAALRTRRDERLVKAALDKVRAAAGGDENVMPSLLDAVRVYATLGEITETLSGVFGDWQEANVF